jgi:aminobenzoyl-glutamate utilization protein B
MRRQLTLAVLLTLSLLSPSIRGDGLDMGNKAAALGSIEKRRGELIKLSDQIWAYAETALREHKSSKALADYAEQQGLKVERGIAGMPTAFIASYGQGSPVIGILGSSMRFQDLAEGIKCQRTA